MNLSPQLLRHRAEVIRLLANKQYEEGPQGLFFPAMGLTIGGAMETAVNGGDIRNDHNIVVTEGLNYILDVALHDATKFGTWYVALFGNNVAPALNLTAATFEATLDELTAYSEAARPAFVEAATTGGVITNAASKAVFTINGPLANWGAALLSDSAKESVASGQKLLAAVKYAAVRNLIAGDIFSVQYSLTATSS